MRLAYTKRFLRDYSEAPPRIQRAIDKQLAYLKKDLRHPSRFLEGVIPHPK